MKHLKFIFMCVVFCMGMILFLGGADAVGVEATGMDQKAYDNPYGNTRVVCYHDPTQTYELYIPATTPSPSPILYCFDPGGNGKSVLLSMAAAALEHGWIVAASNNSKNGPWVDIFKAQDAVLQDTEFRLDLHPTRRFATGFSGGARASLALAYRYPEKICGVLGMGAGGPNNTGLVPSTQRMLSVYIIIGIYDSNYSCDVPYAQGELIQYNHPCVVKEWNANHVFPSANLVLEGCRWLEEHAEVDPNAGLAAPACPDIALVCQAPPSPNHWWISHTSDTAYGEKIYEHFSGMTKAIARLDWWAISAAYHNTGGWLPRPPATSQFRVTFYDGNSVFYGNMVHQETVSAQREDLPHRFSRNFPLYHFSVNLSAPVALQRGWVLIEQIRNQNQPALLWMNSTMGDYASLNWSYYDEAYYWLDYDMSLALSPVDMHVQVKATPTRGKPPLRVRFQGRLTGNYEPATHWRWDFGDGEVDEGMDASPTHVYTNEGSYTVSLEATVGGETVTCVQNNLVVVDYNMPIGFGARLMFIALMLSVGICTICTVNAWCARKRKSAAS